MFARLVGTFIISTINRYIFKKIQQESDKNDSKEFKNKSR